MNKIYKVIWSKVKHCYVVVSELAKSHTKSPNSGSIYLADLENRVNLQLCRENCGASLCMPPVGFVAGNFPCANPFSVVGKKEFKITVAAIVKNEAENVSKWIESARSCADEIIVVDTGSTDDTVERFANYGVKCYHYEWNDDFASAKNYMISLCHGDWIVLLDGDEWFRDGCDVRKAIAKHHNNPITKAIIADWICLDKDRNNAVMFSGGAVRAFRNEPTVRYFRKVHENLTINYENFAFEPDFKMYHTGYSGSVNRSKHERNLRIMRTMFDFDNGKVEYPTDWRYIEDTYAGLGEFDKALWAADKMISYGIQEYSASAWITKFNVLFAMRVPVNRMIQEFEYCFATVPSVSGFRFLAAIYYFRNGLVDKGLTEYIEGLRMLMGPQDRVAQEHTFWRMYLPEASALASAVYLKSNQIEAALYVCKVSEQYCGKLNWTDNALVDIRRITNNSMNLSISNITDKILPTLSFAKQGVLATAVLSSIAIGLLGNANPVYAVGPCTIAACVTGGRDNTASGCWSSVSGGYCNKASGDNSFVGGGSRNTASCSDASVFGGDRNKSIGIITTVVGGWCNTASGDYSVVIGGSDGYAYAVDSVVIGGGVTGVSTNSFTAVESVAIGKDAKTTKDREIAIGSSTTPITLGGNVTVTGSQTVSDGTNSKTWTNIIKGYTLPAATSSALGGVKVGTNITNSSGTISLTKANVVAALGYTPPTTDTNTTYSNMSGASASAAGTAGLVPAPAKGAQNYVLHGDGTWKADANTTYSAFTGATSSAAGAAGLVKAPAAGDQAKFLRGDGTWAADNNTTYAAMTASEATTGTATTARSITAKVLADYVGDKVTTAKNGTIIGLSISGKTITYTKGDGTTGTLTTQDNNTTYSAMSADELTTGTATTSRTMTAKVVSDYVKGKTDDKITGLSISGKTITYTKGDGTTGTITTQDTTYSGGTASILTTGTETTNKLWSGKVLSDYVSDSVATETTNRTTADTALGNRIGTLSTDGNYIKKSDTNNVFANLSVLDTQLKTTNTSVSSEVTNRTNADTLLSNRIGMLSADGHYIKKADTNNISANLTALDTALRNVDTIALKYDGSDHSLATFDGTNGTKLSNLKQGILSASSTDAVTGAQLFATNQNIAGFATDITRNKNTISTLNTSITSALSTVSSTSVLVDTLNSLKADTSLNNLTIAGRQVIATVAANAVQEYMASQQNANNVASPVAPMAYNPNTLNVTNAGNGSLFVGEGSNVNGSSSIAIGVGNQVNANNSGAFGDPSIINADESYVLGNDDTINTGAVGSFVVGNDSVSSAKGGLTFGSNNTLETTAENSVALGNNVTINGKNSVALGSNSTVIDDNVVSVGSDILKRRITNVLDGNITEDSTDAVTGSQLYATNQKVQENTEAITKKANLDGSNIDVMAWSDKLGIGTVEAGNTMLVNGDTVFNAIQEVKDNSLIQQNGDTLNIGGTVGGNIINVANNNGDGRVITGVITDPTDASSATNVGYVQSVSEKLVNAVNDSLYKVDNKINKLGANASALAALTPASFEGDEKWSLAASVGHYHGETGGAVGAFYKPTENVMMNVRMAGGNGENMVAAGVAVSLTKGDIPGVTKRQLAKEVVSLKQNQQALIEARENDQQKIAEQNDRINEQDKQIKELMKRLEVVEKRK